MAFLSRAALLRTGQDRASWLLLLFLLCGVLVPAGGILWLTNRTAEAEAAEARREIAEAYQGQLRLLRERADRAWRERGTKLGDVRSFPQALEWADSAVLLAADGTVAFPVALRPMGAEPAGAEWLRAQEYERLRDWPRAIDLYRRIAANATDSGLAARALQSQVRAALQSGQTRAALDLLESGFRGSAWTAVDTQGRRLAGDQLLLAASVAPARDRKRLLDRLVKLLKDYGTPMPSAQRAFLMEQAVELGAAPFPEREAERLAVQFLDAEQPRAALAGLQATNLAGVWKLPSPDGRVLGLFRTETVEAVIRSAVEEQNSSGARLTAIPPGSAAGDASVAAGPMLPGWQLAFTGADAERSEAESRRRRNLYLWSGYLVVAGIVLTGALLSRSLRKQMTLARLKTDMVAAVSHELKTPLASMRLLVDSLMQDETPDARKTREYLALIAGENQRLTRLIDNFLTFSRMEQRRAVFDFAPARPEQIVRDAVAAVRERFAQGGCSVDVHVERDLPEVRADSEALTTVLTNLLDNAYKYTPGEKRLAVRAYRERDRVVFAVADNGIGIPAREQQRIFRRFYQVDRSLARETGGVGLGLSIVQHIVEAHGGSVSVTSAPGEGSTFRVALPEMHAA